MKFRILKEAIGDRKSLSNVKISDYEITLMEETLSDGSKVYNVYLSQDDHGTAFDAIEFPCPDIVIAEDVYAGLVKLVNLSIKGR